MIDYMRFTVSKVEGGYAYSVSFDADKVRLDYFGLSRSLLESFTRALLFLHHPRKGKLSSLNLAYLMLAVEGLSHGQIAKRMGLKRSAISYHARQVRRHFGAQTEAQAVFLATIGGFLQPYEPGGWSPEWLE